MEGRNAWFGNWSVIGTYILLLLVALTLGSLGPALEGVWLLISGQVHALGHEEAAFLTMLSAVIAIVVIELPVAVGAGILQTRILGKSGAHGLRELLKNMTEDNHFFKFFVLVLAEELFARWLFLGLLPKIPFLSGTVAFYALFLLGNSIWALVHLANYKDPAKRHWLRVLPQFVAGIFFTYVFVQYGLLAAVLCHFASNSVIFAIHKAQRVNGVDALIMIYSGICAALSYMMMDKPMSDALAWLAHEPAFQLAGWQFWDYILLSLFISAVLSMVFSALLYDNTALNETEKSVGAWAYIVGVPIAITLFFGLYMLLGLFISDVPYRILVMAILFAFMRTSTSGSTMSRTFWTSLPTLFIAVCVMQALGWWLSFAWLGIHVAVSLPEQLLNKYDD